MSRTQVYLIYATRLYWYAEPRITSFCTAPIIWGILFKKYRGCAALKELPGRITEFTQGTMFGWDESKKGGKYADIIWPMWQDPAFSRTDRICWVLTFDHIYIARDNLYEVAHALSCLRNHTPEHICRNMWGIDELIRIFVEIWASRHKPIGVMINWNDCGDLPTKSLLGRGVCWNTDRSFLTEVMERVNREEYGPRPDITELKRRFEINGSETNGT